MTKSIFYCAVTLLMCTVCTSAHADLYIDAGPGSIQESLATGDYTIGQEFTVNDPNGILFDQLGYLDAEGDGLVESHQVGLWRTSDQALIASVFVTPTSSTELSAEGTGVWHMESIGSPILLNAGTYRVAGFTGLDGGTLNSDKIGNGVTLSSGYVRTTFPGGGFNYPNLSFSSNFIRTTFGLSSSSVPEPGSIGLLACLGASVMVRRRRRGKTNIEQHTIFPLDPRHNHDQNNTQHRCILVTYFSPNPIGLRRLVH